MSHSAKIEYLKTIYIRYKNSNKLKKTAILDEFCAVSGLSRKHAIRMLKTGLASRVKRSGPKFKYDEASVLPALKTIWIGMGEVNAKKVQAGIKLWLLDIHESDYPELFTEDVRDLLLKISASTIERFLKKIRDKRMKGLSATKPNKYFYNRIPIQAKDWNVVNPGKVQADTVAHCGDGLLGAYAYSLTVTDIFSGWTENRAIWTKGTEGVLIQMESVEKTLPFEIEVFKSDSGTEFMSFRMERYFLSREKPIKMVRSRPYKKDDNCYVEQKNFTHVRELFGYDRIPEQYLVELMNEIYIHYWNPLQNFFIPSTKLIRKTRVGSRIKKEFEPYKTPFQRVIDSGSLTEEQKNKLIQSKQSLSPFKLRKGLDEKLRLFFELLRRSNAKAA